MKKVVISVLVAAGLFGFNFSNASNSNSTTNQNQLQEYNYGYVVEGKVLRAYKAPGFGPRRFEWLFMDVETKNGIVKVGIAPTFRVSNLPINEGDRVRVNGYTPPYWPNGVIKAWDIYDVSQKKDYPIVGWGPGRRWGRFYR